MVLAPPNKLPINYKEGESDFIVRKPGRDHLTSGVPGLAHASLWKPTVCISSQLCVQWCHIGSLKQAMVEAFTLKIGKH